MSCTQLFVFCILFLLVSTQAQDYPSMEKEEAQAVFDVLQAINPEIDWRTVFPGDNPCTGGPHGVNCDVDDADSMTLHVVELNLGWVSDIVNNPPCGENATIHRSILKFRYLRKLFFYQCFVNDPMTIPDEISRLTSLLHLTFQDNTALVGGIPASLANLTKLERLVLTENRLGGKIPPELGRLRNLKQLVLSHNLLSFSIPESFSGLESLMILDLSGNSLSGYVPSMEKLSKLQKMDLSINLLQGRLPSLSTRIEFVDLSYNNLSGGIPDSFSTLSGIQNLFLRGNPLLGGEIPGFLGNLSSLVMLALSGSGFAGSIPESIGDLQRLNSLALNGNMLSGKIPESMGRLRRLYHLNLSDNRLFGPLPFDRDFLGRLGRNLAVRNNSGLCHADGIEDGDEKIGKCEVSETGFGISNPSQPVVLSGACRLKFSSLLWFLVLLLA